MTIETAQKAKIEKTLSKLINHRRHGVCSRAQLVEKLLAEGNEPFCELLPDYAILEKVRNQMEGIHKRWVIGLSNENLPEVKLYREYEKKLANNEYTKPEYYIGKNGEGYVCTKTEYDYALTLNGRCHSAQ